ncbi:MAG: oligoendopeptidase F [Chloroflexota bacterium]|nr:oligoendopeptidase F [Chloroflexota bacterium]
MTEQQVPERSEIDPQFTWNAASVFPSDEAWGKEYRTLSGDLDRIRGFQGRLGEGPSVLADALATFEELKNRIEKVVVYASIAQSVDSTDQTAAQRSSMARGLMGQGLAAGAFLDAELLAVGQSPIEAWMAEEPGLGVYAHYFNDLFRKKGHVRSAEVEELLGMVSDPFSGSFVTYTVLGDADMTFAPAVAQDDKEIPLSQGSLDRILHGTDREARRSAWENYRDSYLAFKNTFASNLSTSIKQNVFRMRARNYPTTLEMGLFEDNIPVEVFHNLIDTFRKNLPTWHRYWRVRRKALGVETLHPYDIWAPLTDNPPGIAFEQAVDWIGQGLMPLGDSYVETLRRGCLEQRWIDIFPNQGKGSGAFSSGSHGTYPFIVMNYTGDAASLGTLAHELGHSMHSYLAWENQPVVYGDYTIFAAEVASNFHQAMVRGHLFDSNPSRELEIAIIEEAMENFHRYFLIMPTLARFELEAHRRVEDGEGLTADGMIALLADLYGEAFGGEMHLDRERVGIDWATFPHLYADYYVFQYATGISGAHALANRIRAGEPGAVDDYLSFLKAGGSMYPLDALSLAGVDLTSPEPVNAAFAVLSDMIDRLERLIE